MQRSARSRNGRRRRGVSLLCVAAAVVGFFLLVTEHVFLVSVRKHFDHGQDGHEEKLPPLEASWAVALEEGRVRKVARRGEHD